VRGVPTIQKCKIIRLFESSYEWKTYYWLLGSESYVNQSVQTNAKRFGRQMSLKNYSFLSEFCNLHSVIKAYCHQKVKNNLNVN
jgi:hypothetical protein